MASQDVAHIVQSSPFSTGTLPDDRLSVLPIELLDIIYSLVFHSEKGPCTLHIRRKLPSWPADYDRADRDSILSILALRRDHRYKAGRLDNPDEKWPDEVEEAFFRALDWAYRQKCLCLNELIPEIIYELTGVRRCRKNVSSHIQQLKNWAYDMKPASEHILTAINRSGSALQKMSALGDMETITETIENMQAQLPKLLEAFREEHQTARPPRPMVDFSYSPIITTNAEGFRLLSSIASDPNFLLSLYTRFPSPLNLSLTLVNRFHRTHTLQMIAASLVYDFGDDIKAIYTLRTPAICHSIKLVRLMFVEGHTRIPSITSVASGSHIILPSLRELFIELWPRNPAREDVEDRSWGEQTVGLLEALKGSKIKVIVEFRWEIDCERFENEYVGVKGWRERERERERMDVDAVGAEEGMCRKSYELIGNK